MGILKNILKSGGLLIIGTPNTSSLAAKIFRGNYRLYGPGHICMYNKKNLKSLLQKYNFQTTRTEYPYWGTDFANLQSFFKMFKPWKISPPFWGSIMTIYAKIHKNISIIL